MLASSTNKRLALGRIQAKLDLLESWASNGIPLNPESGNLEYFPASLRQFNFWDLSSNSEAIRSEFSKCGRTANDTLKQYPHLRAQVDTLLLALKRKNTDRGTSRLDKIKCLKERISDFERYVSVIEHQLVVLRLQHADVERGLRSECSRVENVLREERKRNKKLTQDIEGLHAKVSELTCLLAKIAPIRRVHDGGPE